MRSSWTTKEEAVILQSIKENDSLSEAFVKSARLLNRSIDSVRVRYYNKLKRAKLRKSNGKHILFDTDSVSLYEKEYKQQEDVTIIILHIRGKR